MTAARPEACSRDDRGGGLQIVERRDEDGGRARCAARPRSWARARGRASRPDGNRLVTPSSFAPWYAPSNRRIESRPVKARASLRQYIVASVPEAQNRTRSHAGESPTISSATASEAGRGIGKVGAHRGPGGDGGHDLRMGVPREHRAPTHREIQHLQAIGVPEPAPLAPLDHGGETCAGRLNSPLDAGGEDGERSICGACGGGGHRSVAILFRLPLRRTTTGRGR